MVTGTGVMARCVHSMSMERQEIQRILPEQLAFPGMGPHKKLTGGPGAMPSHVLSQMQFKFTPSGTPIKEAPEGAAGWGYPMVTRAEHIVTAIHRPSGKEAGFMTYRSYPNREYHEPFTDRSFTEAPGGDIKMIHVEPEFRHQGVATHMWNFAHEMAQKLTPEPKQQGRLFRAPRRTAPGNKPIIPPVHSKTRTDAGEGWSAAVGGYRPERNNWRG